MEAFTATLALDPTLLQGLRHSLAFWLDGAGAQAANRDAVVLATHEATAHAIGSGESGGTVHVTADLDGEEGFIVDVRSDGVWEQAGSGEHDSAFSVVAGLMASVATQSSHTLRMKTSA